MTKAKTYRKKPVEIQAVQWFKIGDEGNSGSVGYYIDPKGVNDRPCQHCGNELQAHGWVDTLEGGHIVCPGDFIITGVKGERYPCKPDIFEATYEPVS